MTGPLIVHDLDGVRTLTLHRPERRNALTVEMLRELKSAINEVQLDSSLFAFVIRGSESDFSSGFDLEEGKSVEVACQHASLLVEVLIAIATSSKPSISLATGFTLAGGGAIAGATDLGFATEGVKFGYPVLRVGVVPTPGLPILRRLLGDRALRELTMTGALLDANWAESRGLINRRFESFADAEAHVSEVLKAWRMSSPTALAATKRFADQLQRETLVAELNESGEIFMKVRRGPEAQEGLNAFLEKRAPEWR